MKLPASPVDTALLEVEGLHFAWPGQAALLDIPSLRLGTGESLFLHGPSGSGKTTLLGLIAGVLQPQRGNISLRGTAISALTAAQRDRWRARHISYIFQQFNLLPYLTVIQNVLLPLRFCAQARPGRQRRAHAVSEARQLMTTLGIDAEHVVDSPVGKLSVGQQQRVAAARALITNPDLLIADEPTSSLDADARRRFLALLFGACRANGTAMIFVSHDLTLAGMFDRSVRLSDINRACPR